MLKKTYNTLHSCHNFPAGLRQAARGTRIGETSVFELFWFIPGMMTMRVESPKTYCQTSNISHTLVGNKFW